MRLPNCLIVYIVFAAFTAAPLAACGPFPIVARFWHERHPGVSFEELLDGELGILDRGHRPLDLFVAYRQLKRFGVGAARGDLLGLRRPAAVSTPSAMRTWCAARLKVPGTKEIRWIDTTRHEMSEENGSRSYVYFQNCFDDAFRTATRTLEERIDFFGADAPVVREWLEAQDLVFQNCGEGRFLPEPIEDDGLRPPLARYDRDYQIAAVYFYSRGYAEAEERFRAIAAEPVSPWSEISHYLVARVMARDGRRAEAAAHLEALLADPARASLHSMAEDYREHLLYLLDPAAHHRRMREVLAAPELPAQVRQTWIDFDLSFGFAAPDEHDLDLWLSALRSTYRREQEPDPAALVRARRAEEGDALWRTAALLTAEPADTDFGDLLADVAAVPLPGMPEAPPDAVTVAYHRARLLLESGRHEDAREIVDSLLAGLERLTLGDRNRTLMLASRLAEDMETYLRRVQLAPVEVGYYDGGQVYPRDNLAPPGVVLLHDDAVALLNRLTGAELAEVAASAVLAPDLAAYLTGVAWSRAAFLGDPATAAALAPRLAEIVPALAPDLAAWRDAAPEDRDFVAALVSLRHPGLHPDVHTQLGQLGEVDGSWWCKGARFHVEPEAPLPSFVEPADEREAAPAALVELPSAPIHLGNLTLRHADRRPDDPRLPEALHRVVRGTRYGCDRGTYAEISRAAFQRLHRDFPASPWTAKTPYWFK